MQSPLAPEMLSKNKDFLHLTLKLMYLIQMEEKSQTELEELGNDVYLTDTSQNIWKLQSEYNGSMRAAYLDKLRS